MKKDIAVVVQTLVQFYNIRNGIDELKKKNITCDIYVPTYEDSEGFKEIYDATYNKIVDMGYPVKRKATSTEYKILLEAYPIDHIINIKHKYRLNYLYGSSVGTKPNIGLLPDFYLHYDGVLLYNYEESEYLSAYCKTFLIGNLKFKNFSKKQNDMGNKKRILYLPTYGKSSDIDCTINLVEKLRKKYVVYIKAHHGTDFLKEEKFKTELLKKSCDLYFDSSQNIIDLLSEADLVLSDNSGAIFDSIYAGVPVVIFSKDVNRNKINDDFNTKQFELVKNGIIPYTSDPSDIEKIIKEGLENSTLKKQMKYRDENFYCPDDKLIDFINVISLFLKDKIDKKYKTLHDRLMNYYDDLKKENIKVINNYDKLNYLYKKSEEEKKDIYEKLKNITQQNKLLDNKVNRLYMKIRSKLIFGGKDGKD